MNNLTENQKSILKWALWMVIIAVLAVTGIRYPVQEDFADFPYDEVPVALGTTHFTNLEAEDITATDDLTVTDDASIGGDLTVTGATASTGAQTFSGAVTVNNNLIVTGTGRIDGATNLNSTLDVDGNITSGTGAVTITDSANITGAVDFDSTLNVDGAVTLNSTLDVDGNISSGTGAVTVTDNVDITGTLQFGSNDLYALGHATSGKQIVCGTTGVFTDSTDLAISALTTIDGIVVSQITLPAATGELLYISAVSGYTATVKSIESDYSVGTTGVNAYYCAVGNQ